jgi:hypothetical protein
MSSFTYTTKKVTATPRNKRLADIVAVSESSSYIGGVSDYTNYWKLITTVTDSDGNVTTLAQPYIITSYPVVSEQDITAFGAGEGGNGLKISDLADVDVSGIADNYVLVWDAINSKWVTKAQSGGVTTVFTSTANGLVPMSGTTSTSKYLNANGGWTTPPNTTYSFASASSSWGWAVSGGASFSWTHPSATAYSSGLYKVTVDAYGHVTSATSVSKSDITNLGIPSSDTNTTYALSKSGSTITLTSSDGSKTSVTDDNTTYSRVDMVNTIGVFGIGQVGLVPAGGMVSKVLMNYGDWGYPDIIESTYGNHYRFFDSGNPSSFGWVVCVRQDDGVSELGRYIDMHYSGSGDYDYRIELTSTSTIQFGGHVSVKGNVSATGEITAYASSDLRLKKDIATIYNGIDLINKLNPVNFTWNNIAVGINSSKNETDLQAGLIAQDVLKVLPSIVHKQGDYLALDYIQLIPYMISAIQYMYEELKNSKII